MKKNLIKILRNLSGIQIIFTIIEALAAAALIGESTRSDIAAIFALIAVGFSGCILALILYALAEILEKLSVDHK